MLVKDARHVLTGERANHRNVKDPAMRHSLTNDQPNLHSRANLRARETAVRAALQDLAGHAHE